MKKIGLCVVSFTLVASMLVGCGAGKSSHHDKDYDREYSDEERTFGEVVSNVFGKAEPAAEAPAAAVEDDYIYDETDDDYNWDVMTVEEAAVEEAPAEEVGLFEEDEETEYYAPEAVAVEDTESAVVAEETPAADTSPIVGGTGSAITYNIGDKFPSFGTYTTYGDYVTDSIFSQADVTVINIWGTYCSPCINEMPQLGEWSRNMPSNVQIYGIVCDAYDINDEYTIGEANDIIEYTAANFPHLIYSDDMYDLFYDVYAVPTTIFVNRDGYIIGDWIVGADVNGYKNMVSVLLESQY